MHLFFQITYARHELTGPCIHKIKCINTNEFQSNVNTLKAVKLSTVVQKIDGSSGGYYYCLENTWL